MANYAYVENENIVGVYDNLPKNWKNYSNFSSLESDLDYLNSIGWYKIVDNTPQYDPASQKVDNPTYHFDGTNAYKTLEVIDLIIEPTENSPVTFDEQQRIQEKWQDIRFVRDSIMKEFEWRYTRYERQSRLGLPTSDMIESLDLYMQELADITLQEDPFNIQWPVFEEAPSA